MLLKKALGSKAQRAEQATETQAIDQSTEIEAKDGSCTTVADEENQ